MTRRQPPRLPPLFFPALALILSVIGTGTMAHAQATGSRLTIAVVATVGSPHQPHGADVIAAAREAVRTHKGGLSIRLIERTEDCTAEVAEAVAKALVALPESERPQAVVGHLCSPAAIAAARIYAEAGIVMISPGARHPRLTDARRAPVVFRLAARDDRLPHAFASLIATRFAGRRVALVHERAVQARAIVDATEAQLRQHGIRPVLREAYVHGERAYYATIDRLITADAEVMVVPTQPVETRVLLSNLAARGRRMTVIVGDIVAAVAGEAAPGDQRLIALFPWLERPPVSAGASKTAPAPANSPTWTRSHAAVEVLVHAARRAGGEFTAEALVRALETELAPTIAGPIRFDTRGDPLVPAYAPWEWRDGQWQPLAP